MIGREVLSVQVCSRGRQQAGAEREKDAASEDSGKDRNLLSATALSLSRGCLPHFARALGLPTAPRRDPNGQAFSSAYRAPIHGVSNSRGGRFGT